MSYIGLGGFIGIGTGGYNPGFYNGGGYYRPNVYIQPGFAVVGNSYPRYGYGPWGGYNRDYGYGYNHRHRHRHHHRHRHNYGPRWW